MAVYTKRYNGSSWVDAPVKRYNGSSWVDATVNKWDGSKWVQIYPETNVTTSKTLSSSTFNTWRGSKWLDTGTARQGEYSSYGACAGYLGINAGNFTGSGNISAISSAKFSGTRGGAGYYNNDQTLYFYRSNVAPSTSAANTWTGQFTGTTGGPGSGKTMSNRTMTVNAETKNWANKVSSKPYLYIYATGTSNYADIEKTFSVTLSYTYQAKSLVFSERDAVPLLMSKDMYKMRTGKEPYYTVLVHNGEENMSLEEIIKRREDGISEAIPFDSVVEGYKAKPWTREYEVEYNKETDTCTAKIEVLNMRMEDEVQYSLDKEEWNTMYNVNGKTHYHEAELPKDFNRYSDFVYVRVLDKEKEEIVTEMTIEPKIYIPDQTNGIIMPGNIDLKNILK